MFFSKCKKARNTHWCRTEESQLALVTLTTAMMRSSSKGESQVNVVVNIPMFCRIPAKSRQQCLRLSFIKISNLTYLKT